MTLPAVALQNITHQYLIQFPKEAARILELQPLTEITRILTSLTEKQAAHLLELLTPEISALVLEASTDEQVVSWISCMNPSRSAQLLAQHTHKLKAQRLALLDPQLANELREIMSYSSDSAGGLMDSRVTSFRADAQVKQVLARLKLLRKKMLTHFFLVDENMHLTGSVALQDIILATPETPLIEIAKKDVLSVQATALKEEIVEICTQHQIASLPVVDFENRLLGVIRYGALVGATAAEATADMQTMVGVSKDERALSGVLFSVKKRLPWLQINLLTAFLAASVVGLFEETIAKFTALAVLLPVVAGQSGNTGAQALAVTLRGLALREVRVRHWPQLSIKEVSVGAINGVAVAIVTSIGVYLWSHSLGIATVIGCSMVMSMAMAGLAGAAIPMALTILKQDPAQSSSIILTTITDVVGFFSFLGLATLFSQFL